VLWGPPALEGDRTSNPAPEAHRFRLLGWKTSEHSIAELDGRPESGERLQFLEKHPPAFDLSRTASTRGEVALDLGPLHAVQLSFQIPLEVAVIQVL
jgi:hypothetical protein